MSATNAPQETSDRQRPPNFDTRNPVTGSEHRIGGAHVNFWAIDLPARQNRHDLGLRVAAGDVNLLVFVHEDIDFTAHAKLG